MHSLWAQSAWLPPPGWSQSPNSRQNVFRKAKHIIQRCTHNKCTATMMQLRQRKPITDLTSLHEMPAFKPLSCVQGRPPVRLPSKSFLLQQGRSSGLLTVQQPHGRPTSSAVHRCAGHSPEHLHGRPLLLQQGEPGSHLLPPRPLQCLMHLLSAQVAVGSLQKVANIQAAPNNLRGVQQILDSTAHSCGGNRRCQVAGPAQQRLRW